MMPVDLVAAVRPGVVFLVTLVAAYVLRALGLRQLARVYRDLPLTEAVRLLKSPWPS